jgi:hypothetical protein
MCLSNAKPVAILALLVIILLNCIAIAEKTISATILQDKMRGMWLGQLIGNNAGRATEGWYQAYPNPASSVPWVIKQQWDADDDTDFEYIALHTFETDGLDCNFQQIFNQWRTHVTISGIYFANRQAWFLMRDGYLPPQTGSRTYNEHWYSIDSQITTETLGAVSPGLTQQAINLAGKFARVTNEGFPVHAAQLYTAMYAEAFFEPNVITLVTQSLNTIPITSRTYQVATDVLNWYLDDIKDGDPSWRTTRQKLYDYYQGSYGYGRYYLWVESTINTGATVLAILYGNGDFKKTVQIGALAGWDNDCNPATAGGLIGIINGYSGLPTDLTDPNICGDIYKNVWRPYLPDSNLYLPQYDTITNVASRLIDVAEQNILANGGYITYDSDKTYHIPDACEIIPEPEKPDPTGPKGLVADAISSKINVIPTAAVEYHIPTSDRNNLDAIIDGITDNSYNGHKPYYSYLSIPQQRPQQDWYQLNFTRPVKFNTLTFYEGDTVWNGTDTYYRDDNALGGFFNDLTVEILKDGKFIRPADLSVTPPLDRYKMYQIINFTFAPTVGNAIRIIGTPGGTQKFTTIMELETYGDIETGLYLVSVRINDGWQQRSNVTVIAVKFNRDVTITSDDIELTGTTNGTILNPDQIQFSYNPVTYQFTLKFDIDGDENFGDSLPDDTYQLNLDCNSITDANGQTLLDDDQTPGDGFYTIKFHRLFGDADGSASVNLLDFSHLALHWLGSPADIGLDANKDDMLNFLDVAVFADNWLKYYP